jgi:hypothetical protein
MGSRYRATDISFIENYWATNFQLLDYLQTHGSSPTCERALCAKSMTATVV